MRTSFKVVSRLVIAFALIFMPRLAQGNDGADASNETKPAQDSITTKCKELKAPQVAYRVAPEYPKLDLGSGKQGIVQIATIIDVKGKLGKLEVLHSDFPEFVQPALKAVRQWRFKPATCDGRPVAVYYQLAVRFRG